MQPTWSKDIDRILGIGISLHAQGVNNWALSQTQALKVLDQLYELKVAILGGDVYEKITEVLEHTYDSWYYHETPGDSSLDFISKSIETAREYIQEYHSSNERFFALVPMVGKKNDL